MKLSRKNNSSYSNRNGKFGVNLILFLGFVVLCMGIFLTITNSVATGFSIASKFGPGGQPTQINGPSTIFISIVMLSLAIILKFVNKPKKHK